MTTTIDENRPSSRLDAANAEKRRRFAAKLAADLAPRLPDLDKVTFAALAFAVADEIDRRAAERRAVAR